MMTPDQLKAGLDTVVVVMLENRSFDHFFGYLGLPGYGGRTAVTALTDLTDPALLNPAANGTMCPPYISQDGPFATDLPHERDYVATQLAPSRLTGQFLMNGFVAAYERFSGSSGQLRSPPLGLMTPRDIPISSFLAQQFALCDHWFAPLPTSTHPNRLMSLSGYSLIDSTPNALLPDQTLVFDWLEKRNIRWRVYSDGIPFLTLMPHAWPLMISGKFKRLSDLSHDALNEPDTSWPQVILVEPDYESAPVHLSGQACDNHPPLPVAFGEAFLRQVYEALTGAPTARWAKMLTIYTFDEHGGFFDHVPPAPIPSPKPQGAVYTAGGDFATTGVRVPAILISPLVTPGSVKKDLFDHTSILQLIAERFGSNGEIYSSEVDARRQAGVQSVSVALEAGLAARTPPPPPGQPIQAMASLQSTRLNPTTDLQRAFIAGVEGFAKAYATNPDALALFPEIAHWMSP
jgi:phospholipase C